MEHQERKANRLQDYDYAQSGAYFVTICTQDRKPILSKIVGDGSPVPKPIGLIAEEFIRQTPLKYPTVCVDKYVIMPDHIHILLRIDHLYPLFHLISPNVPSAWMLLFIRSNAPWTQFRFANTSLWNCVNTPR